jgi:hypothetical protein
LSSVSRVDVMHYVEQRNKSDLEDQSVTSCWKINTTLWLSEII